MHANHVLIHYVDQRRSVKPTARIISEQRNRHLNTTLRARHKQFQLDLLLVGAEPHTARRTIPTVRAREQPAVAASPTTARRSPSTPIPRAAVAARVRDATDGLTPTAVTVLPGSIRATTTARDRSVA